MFFFIENNLVLFLPSLPMTMAITSPGEKGFAEGRKKQNNFINFKLKYYTTSQRNNKINEEFIP
jgi:hypothetical protein